MSVSAMNKIIDNLWLGDMVGAYNKFLLKRNGITHILTVAQGIMPKFPTQFHYKIINILDMPSANLKQHFQSCIKFIKDAVAEGGTVYVHCYAGVSRSATIIIAYLMQEHGMTFLDGMQHVRKCRWFINPNDGFKRQLQAFNRELANKRSKGDSLNKEETKVETVVKPLVVEKNVIHESVPYKNFMIEGRGGSVPPAIRNYTGLSQSEDINAKQRETLQPSAGFEKQNSAKIGNRATTTFNQIRVAYQSPIPKSSKMILKPNKFAQIRVGSSPYSPFKSGVLSTGSPIKAQVRYPSSNPMMNQNGKGFQISSQYIAQTKY
ncbi:UNKNOWN [Stylonychia lemnae]|uniref:Uncharacterized protein n=1 Tax=Stylonychia lemnae TaxID=5949 RepID=A0A077ZWU2_STYLE|nr:UNKNOWN [Stylonychia lemnae]|eukprot:CDW74386.1 UNKNOWN [Stylonychia lemnae]